MAEFYRKKKKICQIHREETVTKAEKELGWKPSVTFEEGIDKTIAWYLANKPWWEHIISGEYQNYFDKMYGYRLEK